LHAVGTTAEFLFAACQVGAERALKAEFANRWPEVHPAFSRPGFVTFKAMGGAGPDIGIDSPPVFARTCGRSLDAIQGDSPGQLASLVAERTSVLTFHELHVWQRDRVRMGWRGFEPGPTELSRSAETLIRHALANSGRNIGTRDKEPSPGTQVLDVVLIEPLHWHLGTHQVVSPTSSWPGGVPPIALPEHAVSRAYLKMEEAIRWSGFRFRKGEQCAEIGCAPGGASQALLDRGLKVLGVDPAEVSPAVLAHRNFVHVRKRGAEVRRREFRDVDWLMADINVAPQYTLDTVEAIATHDAVSLDGVLLTLKLLDWQLAAEIPQYVDRVRSWGFEHVAARQLAHNRQEICVAARRVAGRRRK
jgi:23S rRNA (cytidine2498-2'-O)-methyltransferase